MVFLFTAPVRTGKTSSLLNWTSNRKDVWGILTPVIHDKRYFRDVHTGEEWPMEAVAGETGTLQVGRFVFSKNGFDKAIKVIRESMHQPGWLLIDEIGPLELRGEGFAEVVNEVLAVRKEKLLLVLREGISEDVIRYFQIKVARVITELPPDT